MQEEKQKGGKNGHGRFRHSSSNKGNLTGHKVAIWHSRRQNKSGEKKTRNLRKKGGGREEGGKREEERGTCPNKNGKR